MRRRTLILGLILSAALTVGSTANAAERNLDIYFLDMVGGGSTLIATPLGESVLIDTGSLRPLHRDADRIVKACEDAGLKQIDYLLTTHFHSDHYGAILAVSRRIPVKHYLHKGPLPPAHEQKSKSFKELYPLYQQATGGKGTTIGAGDDIPLKNDPAGKVPRINLHCVASDKKVEGFDGDIDAPVPGFAMKKPDESDNAYSTALLLAYGDFKAFLGADITWNVEHHLARPVNRIGKVDLYQVTHHGLDQSNNTLLLKALNPTVAIAMNGPRKGIQPRTFKDLNALPDLKAIYQIHYNTQYGDAGNTAPAFIANPKGNPSQGQFIKASIPPDTKTFTLQIGPDGQKRSYAVTPAPPDISHCTRCETRYVPSAFDIFTTHGLRAHLLDAPELKQLRSFDQLVAEDPELIQRLARGLAQARYWDLGTQGRPRVQDVAHVSCFEGEEQVAAFTIKAFGYLATEKGKWFVTHGTQLGSRDFAPELRWVALRLDCCDNIRTLAYKSRAFSKDSASYPAPAGWCDAVEHGIRSLQGDAEYRDLLMNRLRCPSAGPGRCHYAMNPHCEPNSPDDMLLLFETEAGWNQHGGPELFTFDNHDPKGGCVLLNDGTVKFIRTEEELHALRWK